MSYARAMQFRLSGRVGDERISVILQEGSSFVGSEAGLEVRMDEATVSRRHAEIRVAGDRIDVLDLDSKNGTFVGSHKIKERRIYPGTTVFFGRVALTLESVSDEDLELGVRFGVSQESVESLFSGDAGQSTVGLRPVEIFVAEFLNPLLALAQQGKSEEELAEVGGQALFSALPAVRVTVASRHDPGAVVFSASQAGGEDRAAASIDAESPSFRVQVELSRSEMAEPFQPVVDGVAAIMGLDSRVEARGSEDGWEQVEKKPSLPEPGTVVPAMLSIYREAVQVAAGSVGILICGESGTGKEVLARFIHQASRRAQAPFVALNCAALPNDLLEAELFGIERGVATGVDPRPGKFESAHGGTLFLDEIGDMALSIQAKILRVLQEGEVFRLGGSRAKEADCRIIAATNQNMAELRDSGSFREDLYYRIATWVVELPPLRHRRGDIPNLAAHFLRKEAEKRGISVRGITRAALEVLTAYQWPGNVRQLSNEISRAALFLQDGEALEASRLSPELLAQDPGEGQGSLEERLAGFERMEILKALKLCSHVAADAARELGIGRSTLYRRMAALGISRRPEDG